MSLTSIWDMWESITFLGNSVLLLSAVLVMALWLVAGRAWRFSFFLLVTLGVAVVMVLISKIAFLGWGIGIASLDFTGISGHTMLATAVIPTMAAVMTLRMPAHIRAVAIGTSVAVALAVGLSRLVLGSHSLSEVVAGWVVGALVALPSCYLLRRVGRPHPSMWPVSLALLVIFTVTAPHDGGQGPETHALVIDLALRASGRPEPFTRSMLHEKSGEATGM